MVILNIEEFKKLYPHFNLSDETIELYFKAACLLLDNSKKSLVTDLEERKLLLYMLMCHIATLKQNGDNMVGVVTSAAQGSTNISLSPLQNANWYNSTQCGALFWAATAKYRVGLRYNVYRKC